MTVSNINAYSDPENGGDVGTEHTFDFRIDEGAESSVLMQLTDGDGNITYPEYNTDYTVERATEPAVGGTVTTLTDYTGSSVVLYRSTALTQARALPNQGPFLAATIEAMVDKLTMLTQELRRDQDLTLTLPVGTDTSAVSLAMPAPVDGQYLIGRDVDGELHYSSDGMSEATLQSMTNAATADAAAAALSATDAETSATDAETAATGAEAARAAAETARDEAVAASGSVDSFNGRTGVIVPTANDYDISEIENAGDLAALNTVDTAQIVDGAITADKIADGVILPSQGKNFLINGNFDVWQRGTSQSANGYGSADMWDLNLSGATGSFSRQEFGIGQSDVPFNPKYYIRLSSSVADNNTGFRQKIEGVSTLAGQEITVSFWVKHSISGPSSLTLKLGQDFGTGGSPSATAAAPIASAVTTTTAWQKKTITTTVPSIAAKTIGTNGDDNLYLEISNSSNEIFDLDIAQVKLESGGTATDYGYEDPTETLLKCKRYYNEDGVDSGNPLIGWMPDINGSEARAILYTYPVDMLYPPTVTATGDFTITVNNVKEGSCWLSTTAPSPAYGVALYKIILKAEL